MTTPNEQSIPVVKKNDVRANYPFLVQIKNTENWNTFDSTVTLLAAQEAALSLLELHPSLPVQIEHCSGGHTEVQVLPKFKRLETNGERPHRTALWSGIGEPPVIGSRVEISVNAIGPGTVTAYAIVDGYLGLMVLADEATRPLWHKSQNPSNLPALVFGAELKPSLAAIFALWDKLADIPVNESDEIEENFYIFGRGTRRETIWKWFEKKHPSFIVGDVQQGIRHKD